MTDPGTVIDTGTTELLCSIRDRVAVITLNRPHARNSLSDQLTPALRRMIKQTGEDPAVGALLLTGAGTAFCSGGDVKSMGGQGAAPAAPMSFEQRVAQLRERQRTLTGVLVGVRKPTIAALPGPAAGAGMALALACDLRLMADSAIMSTGYARIGLTGDYGISWLLTRLTGTARARELMFLSEKIDAKRCEALGLANRVVADDQLMEQAFLLARTLAHGPGDAYAAMKDNLDQALMVDFLSSLDQEAQSMVKASRTEQHKEAVRAFIEKRPPDFKRG